MTKSHFVFGRFDDGRRGRAILKLRRPSSERGHFGATSLACELISAVLARAIGLDVPDYAIAHVGPAFVDAVTDPENREALRRNFGPNFGSVEILPRPANWKPDCTALSLELRQAIDNVLTFDATILNSDRRAENPNLLWDGRDRVHLIDHGLALPVHQASDEELSTPLLPGDALIRAHAGFQFLYGKRCDFGHVHAVWSGEIDDSFLSDLRRIIPADWEERPGELDRVFRFLRERVSRFQEIMVELRRTVQ